MKKLYQKSRGNQALAKGYSFTVVLALILSVLIGNLTSNPIIFAANDIDPYTSDGDLSLMRCFSKGVSEFSAFSDAMIWNDNWKEGLIEPWNDVIFRNQCQTNDIINLVKQQDKIRSQIRNSLMTCKTQKVPALETAYYKISAEIFYSRHIVDSYYAGLVPSVLLEENDFAIMSRDKIYTQMKAKYVNANMFEQDKFDAFFLQTEAKYKDRHKTYIICNKGSWNSVGESWDEFKDFFTEDFGGLKEGYNGVKGQYLELENDVTHTKIVQLFKGNASLSDYASSFVSAKINNQAPMDTINEIGEELVKDLPTTDMSSVSNKELLSFNSFKQSQHDLKSIEIEMQANFDLLYGNNTDSVEIFIDNLDGNKSDTLGLIEILDNSIPVLIDMKKGLNNINSKQCNVLK